MTPDTVRSLLGDAMAYVERARLNLSFAKQDAVSTAAEAESNRNSAYHDCVQAIAALERLLADAPVGFQARVGDWLQACFGPAIAANKTERNHRFLEESLELVQACGCTQSEAHQLVDYVYGRPIGEIGQEVGGVMNTLAALCLAHGFDMAKEGETEIARCWTKIEKIRAKQAAKPKHSPLPEAPAAPVAPGDEEIVEAKTGGARTPRALLLGVNVRHVMPMYGQVSWKFLVDAVSEATGVTWGPDDGFVGHQIIPTINGNSLNRIVSAALAAARPLLTRQSTRRTDEEVEREIERLERTIGAHKGVHLLARDDARLAALRWTLNKPEPGR